MFLVQARNFSTKTTKNLEKVLELLILDSSYLGKFIWFKIKSWIKKYFWFLEIHHLPLTSGLTFWSGARKPYAINRNKPIIQIISKRELEDYDYSYSPLEDDSDDDTYVATSRN